MKKTILFIGLLSSVFIGFSQNPKIIDTLEIHNQIKLYGIDEKNLDFKYHFFSDIVFLNDSTLLYNPNSTLHLFKIYLGDIPRVSKIIIDIYFYTMIFYIVMVGKVYLIHFLILYTLIIQVDSGLKKI